MESARRRLITMAKQGATGWVFLHSAYAAGYVEVLTRGEDNEYVVRIAVSRRRPNARRAAECTEPRVAVPELPRMTPAACDCQ